VYRTVVSVVAAASIVLGGASIANAAPPPSSVPGTPTAVRVSGSGPDADLTWGAPRSGARVTGYRVTISPAQGQPDAGVDRLPASARWDHFGGLRVGTTYTFAVRAVSARGQGTAVSVRYRATAPVPTVQSLFALDADGAVVRFPTTGRGASTVVASSGAGFTADDRGDVFVPSADRTSIVMYPAGGGVARTVATGLHLTADLRSDVAGNLYWQDSVSAAITVLPIAGGAPRVVLPFSFSTIPSQPPVWAVGPDGTVSTVSGKPFSSVVTQASPSGAVTTRPLKADGIPGVPVALLADASGDLYVDLAVDGPAGYFFWFSMPAGQSTLTRISDASFGTAATNATRFALLQSVGWCNQAADVAGTCTADRSITTERVTSADGALQTLPVSGVTAGSRRSFTGAASSDGAVFTVIDQAPTPGLWRVPPGGGVAQQLSTAQFTRLLVT
jgi:hypothetical protein